MGLLVSKSSHVLNGKMLKQFSDWFMILDLFTCSNMFQHIPTCSYQSLRVGMSKSYCRNMLEHLGACNTNKPLRVESHEIYLLRNRVTNQTQSAVVVSRLLIGYTICGKYALWDSSLKIA